MANKSWEDLSASEKFDALHSEVDRLGLTINRLLLRLEHADQVAAKVATLEKRIVALEAGK